MRSTRTISVEPPYRATPDVDEVVDEVDVIEGRADATLVVGGIKIEYEVEVASHAWLRVNGERPRSGHEVTDGQTIEPIEDLTFDIHPGRIGRSLMASTAYPPAFGAGPLGRRRGADPEFVQRPPSLHAGLLPLNRMGRCRLTEKAADGRGTRIDPRKAGHRGEGPIGGDERFGLSIERDSGQDGIERAEFRVLLVQLQSAIEVGPASLPAA
jgi:hypothetical protein